MKIAVHEQKSIAIIYASSRMELPVAEAFTAQYWAAQGLVEGQAVGRGSAWFIDAPAGSMVLRRYLRGGWAAKLSHQHYLFTGVSRSRPFREFTLTASLHSLGLPVPQPLAALCSHHGILSSGALMTGRIKRSKTLADMLPDVQADAALWADVGRCIRRFHLAGVWHADLNARNILLDMESAVFLIDFDRARYTPGKVVDGRRNLARLQRSLVKLWPSSSTAEMQPAWAQLMAAYHE